jgi:hypothetical protein
MKRLIPAVFVVLIPAIVLSDEPKNLLKPVNKAESWRFETHEGALGKLEIVDDIAVFKAGRLTGTNWHIQAFQTDLDLKEGKDYVLTIKMRGTQRRSVTVVATIDKEDWHEIGLHEEATLDKDLKTFEFTFRASDVADKKNRIGFVLGDETGDLFVKEITLTEKVKK